MVAENYFKKTRYPYNLTEKELDEAFDMYYRKTIMDIWIQLEEKYPFLSINENESFNKIILHAADVGITFGMMISVENNKVIQYYLDRKKAKGEFPKITEYEFQDGKGVSGILDPNGEFIKCGNQEHHIIAEYLSIEDQYNSIYFSSSLIGDDRGIISFSPLSKKQANMEQLEWMKENQKFFDEGQLKFYKTIILQGDKNEFAKG